MKFFTKKRIAFVLAIAAALGLAQCDLLRVWGSQTIGSTPKVDFPLGEGKTISYSVNSWVKKPYIITLKIEYPNYQKKLDSREEIGNIPYRISVKCYKLEKTKETLFFQDTYVIRDKIYHLDDSSTFTRRENLFEGNSGWNPNNPDNPYASGVSSGMGGFDLPYGKYRCDFKDESPPEIKHYLQKANITRTAIHIFPYEPFIY